jgi:hypothetical protein
VLNDSNEDRLNVLVDCAFLVGTSNLDHRGEQLVLELFDNPTYKARVTAFSNEALLNTLALEDYIVQEILRRIKQRITDAAITFL